MAFLHQTNTTCEADTQGRTAERRGKCNGADFCTTQLYALLTSYLHGFIFSECQLHLV